MQLSDADLDISDRLIQVGIIVDTEVIDHLIISTKSYLSFKDAGLWDKLKKSTKYVPQYVLEQRMKDEATEIAKRNEKLEIARAFKKSGVDDALIAINTGLSLEEVQQLTIDE